MQNWVPAGGPSASYALDAIAPNENADDTIAPPNHPEQDVNNQGRSDSPMGVSRNAAVSDKALGISLALLCAPGSTVLLNDAAAVTGKNSDRQSVMLMGLRAPPAARLVQNLGASG